MLNNGPKFSKYKVLEKAENGIYHHEMSVSKEDYHPCIKKQWTQLQMTIQPCYSVK